MGKRKESGTEEELFSDSPGSAHKKHKKHKKKHKKKKDHDPFPVISPDGAKPAIKLKLKIGGETLSEKNILTPVAEKKADSSEESQDQIINVTDDTWGVPEGSSEKGVDDQGLLGKKNEDTSDEEKEWLDALERGDLDDSGMLKKQKDPKLLTARQRALLHGSKEEELLQLPSGYKTVELTEEQVMKRQQRAKKRRQQAHEKREKDKKQTLDRLLKKQESKNKGKGKGSKRANVPKLRYTNNHSGVLISVPVGFQFPFTRQITKSIPAVVKCGVFGCTNNKKYSCSKTGVPLCSLQCYKKNLSAYKSMPFVQPAPFVHRT